MQVDMYRVAALYVVERYKPHVLEDIRRALRRARLAQDRAAAAADNAPDAAAQRLRALFPGAQQSDQHAALARQSQVRGLIAPGTYGILHGNRQHRIERLELNRLASTFHHCGLQTRQLHDCGSTSHANG